MKSIDEKIVEAIKSGDEKKLQKYAVKKHIDTFWITEHLKEYAEFELAEKFNLLNGKRITKFYVDYCFRKAYERNDIERMKSLKGHFRLDEKSASFIFSDAVEKKNSAVIKILIDVADSSVGETFFQAISKDNVELRNLLLDAGVGEIYRYMIVATHLDTFVNSIKKDPRVIQTLEMYGRGAVLYWALRFHDNQLKEMFLQDGEILSNSVYNYCNHVYSVEEKSDYQMLAEAIKTDDRVIGTLCYDLKVAMLKKMILEDNIEMQNKLVKAGAKLSDRDTSFDVCVDAIRKNNNLSKAFATEARLSLAIKNKASDIVSLLLDAGVDKNNQYLKDVCRLEDLQMMLAYMKKQVSAEEFVKKHYGTYSTKCKKFIEIYDKPEDFLKLNLVLTDDEVTQFKKAAMYGLMKRYKDMPEHEKTAEFEKKNAAIVRKIKEKAEQIERPNKEVEEKRNERVIETISSLAKDEKTKE